MRNGKRTPGCLPYGYRRGGAVRPRLGFVLYHVGLGSNRGDRRARLEAAIAFLAGCGRVLKRSSVYETSPVGMPGSAPFLNMAVALESALPPIALLQKCKEHEAAQGREAAGPGYRDRPIDIDILMAGDLVMAAPELTVPHPRLHERGFVLVPLFEIAPRLVHPLEKATVAQLLSRLKGGETIVRLE